MQDLQVGDKVVVWRPYHCPKNMKQSTVFWAESMNAQIGYDATITEVVLADRLWTTGDRKEKFYKIDIDNGCHTWAYGWLRRL